MHRKNPLPVVDHGVDIIGDEWEEPEEEDEVEKALNDILPIPKKEDGAEYEKRFDPVHPYCTNWPIGSKKEKKDENV